MATEAELRTLRLYVDDKAGQDQFFDDSTLQQFIFDAGGDLNNAAASLWKVKAARVTEWYTVNMDGNFMTRGEVFDHCLKMSQSYAAGGVMTNVRLTTREPDVPIDEYAGG